MDSMDNIYKQHAKTVYGFLLSKTHNEYLAEELTQETFYQAVRSANRFEGRCSVVTWLCAIAKNLLIQHLRKQNRPPIDTFDTALSSSAEENVLAKLNLKEIMTTVHSFEDPMREVMYLRLTGELSFREIADILGRTENWARVTYYRGKEKLLKEVAHNE